MIALAEAVVPAQYCPAGLEGQCWPQPSVILNVNKVVINVLSDGSRGKFRAAGHFNQTRVHSGSHYERRPGPRPGSRRLLQPPTRCLSRPAPPSIIPTGSGPVKIGLKLNQSIGNQSEGQSPATPWFRFRLCQLVHYQSATLIKKVHLGHGYRLKH